MGGQVGIWKAELETTDKTLKYVTDMKETGIEAPDSKWEAFIPGVQDHMLDRFEDEDYLENDEDEKVAALDFGKIQKDVTKASYVPEDMLPVGDIDIDEEKALMAKGTWSVARLYAGAEERSK